MNKTKTFTQHYGDSFTIRISIRDDGSLRSRSSLKFHGENDKNRINQWRKNNAEYIIKRRKEKYKDNKEHILQKNKIFYKNNKDKILERNKKYNKTDKGKEVKRISQFKRKNFGFNPLNDYFIDAHFHHIHINNHDDGIFISKELHRSIWHSYKDQKSMDKINKLAFEWLNEKN